MAELRSRAASRLTGLAATKGPMARAGDALTLLHDSRAELESALRRQIEVYYHVPVGLFSIDARFVMHELNQPGAALLGLGRDDGLGLPLDAFMSAESARRLKAATCGFDAGTAQPPACSSCVPGTGRRGRCWPASARTPVRNAAWWPWRPARWPSRARARGSGVTRQTTLPTSSTNPKAPRVSSATPTGRQALRSFEIRGGPSASGR